VITFTNRAAFELAERMNRLGLGSAVCTSTFHAVALAELRSSWASLSEPNRAVAANNLRLIRLAMDLQPEAGRWRSRKHELAEQIAAEISFAKARCLDPAGYERADRGHGRVQGLSQAAVARVYRAYEAIKVRRRVIDLDDILILMADLIDSHAALAAGQRQRFRHFFVDEFQDVNPAQLRLLRAWLGPGPNPHLTVVGDTNQAIYGWNGADPTIMDRFHDWFGPGRDFELRDNYRCTPEILAASESVLYGDVGNLEALGGRETETRRIGRSAHGQRPHRASGPRPDVAVLENETEEADTIAHRIRRSRHQGHSWSDHAVLARTNAQLAPLTEAFDRANIPYRTAGAGSELLASRPIVEALDELMSLKAKDALRMWVTDLTLDLFGLEAIQESDEIEVAPATPVHLLPPYNPHARPSYPSGRPARVGVQEASRATIRSAAGDQRAALEALLWLAEEYLAIGLNPAVRPFRAWLRATLSRDSWERPHDGPAVTLTTFHRSKGLEWPVVFVIGMEEGFAPAWFASGEQALAEERRLVYVAMTRASTSLHLTLARRRTTSDGSVDRRPSPYLGPIEAALRSGEVNSPPPVSPARARDLILELRSTLT
jgi:DNA helicase-2/ATP-dependent DNA helicase PcrA